MKRPPSLGDSTQSLKRIQQTYDLPSDRQGVIARLEQILSSGGVQKIVVELGYPIRVDRLVKKSEVAEDVPEQDIVDDLMHSIRNGEIYDFPQKDTNPFAYLFQAFHILFQKRLKATMLLVHSIDELRKHLNVDGFLDLTEVYGVDVKAHPEVPDQTALLVAVDPDDLDTPSFSIRLTIDPQKGI